MRYLLSALISVCAFFAQAQQINPVPDYVFGNRMSVGRTSVTDTAAYFSIGPRYGAIRGMMPPMVVDTASVSGNKRNGLLIFSVQKNKFVYWDSVGSKWAEMAGTGGTAINSGDTAAMLLPYLRKADTTAMLAPYLKESDTVFLSNRINLKVNISDTSSMLTNYVRHAGYGLTKSGQSFLVDTAAMATRARVQKAVDSLGSGKTNGSGTTNYVSKWTGASTLGNSLIFDNGTNISAGGTFANGRFNIIQDSAVTVWGLFQGETFNETGKFISGNLARGPMRNYAGTHKWFTNPELGAYSERMRIDGDGNVGIGTSSPSYTTDIAGTLRSTLGANFATTSGNVGIGTASPQQNVHANASTGAYLQLSRTAQGGTTSPFGGIYFGDGTNFQNAAILSGADGDVVSGNLQFATRVAAGSLAVKATLTNAGELLIGSTSDAGAYALQVAGSIYNTTGAVLAASSGNVGIGTASPVSKFEVRDGDASVTTVSSFSFYNNNRNTVPSSAGVSMGGMKWRSYSTGTTYETGTQILSFTEAAWSSTSAPSYISFQTTASGSVTPTQRMRVNSDGEVWLGTDTDAGAYALQVAGSIYNTTGAVLAASSGNVTIGATPSAWSSFGAPVIEMASGGTLVTAGVTATFGSNWYYDGSFRYKTNFGASYYLQNSGRHIWYQAPTGTAGNAITFTSPMEINAGGELLVGSGFSDAGDYKLQVNGNERIAGKLDVITTTEYAVNIGRSGTSATTFQAYNSTAAMAVGIESSAGGGLFTGTSAYAAVFGNANNYPTQFVTNNTLRATISAAGELLVGTTSDQGDYNIQTNNAIYAAGNAAGVGVLVGSDKSIETTGVNLNLNANQGGAGTSTISMKLTSATPAFTFTSDAVMLFGTNTYSTMTNGLSMKNGTAPTGSATDQFHMYSADITAGNAAPHFRTENNSVIKLYQETTGVAAAAFTANSGTAVNDASTFDGYTLKQVVKALRNLGILQ